MLDREMQTTLFLAFWFKKLPSQFRQEVSANEYKVLKVALFFAIEKLSGFVGRIFGSGEGVEERDEQLLDVNNPPSKERIKKMDESEKEKLQENTKVHRMLKSGKMDKYLGSSDTDLKAEHYRNLGFFDRIAENRRERLAEEIARKKGK